MNGLKVKIPTSRAKDTRETPDLYRLPYFNRSISRNIEIVATAIL